MKEEDKLNCDIEVYNLTQGIKAKKDEAVFYIRAKGNGEVMIAYTGNDISFTQCFHTVLMCHNELHEPMATALVLYEENNQDKLDEEEKNKIAHLLEWYDTHFFSDDISYKDIAEMYMYAIPDNN